MAQRASSKTRRVLLVDGHADSLSVLERLMAGSGFEVATARTAQAARDLAARAPFDLIVCELTLPDGSGDELIGHLKAKSNIRAIALCASAYPIQTPGGSDSAFDRFILKPSRFEEILAAIEGLLGHAPPAQQVLVVEEDQAFLYSLTRAMRHQGLGVVVADNFAEAQAALDFSPSWIVIALSTAGEDAIMLLERIRREKLPINIAVLAARGHKNLLDRVSAFKPEIISEKPADVFSFVQRLRQ